MWGLGNLEMTQRSSLKRNLLKFCLTVERIIVLRCIKGACCENHYRRSIPEFYIYDIYYIKWFWLGHASYILIYQYINEKWIKIATPWGWEMSSPWATIVQKF